MPDRNRSPFVAPECWHSFDGGQLWSAGRPSRHVEATYPAPIRYRFAATPPPNMDALPLFA